MSVLTKAVLNFDEFDTR